MCVCVCVYIYTDIDIYIHTYIFMYVYIYLQCCDYLTRTTGLLTTLACVCVCVCVCVCSYIYIHMQWCDYVTRTTGRLTKSVRLVDTRGFTMSSISYECLQRDGAAMVFLFLFYLRSHESSMVSLLLLYSYF
jgi:hypothetical protein